MKSTVITGVAIALISTSAFAQDMTRDQMNQHPSQTQQKDSGATPTARMGDAAKGGASQGNSDSGKLMQQREQGMSPNAGQPGGAGGNSTGTMKQ